MSARPMSYLSKTVTLLVKTLGRPIHKNTTFKISNINQRVNTVRGKKFNTARTKAVVNAVKGNNVNAVKASTCLVWKPKYKVLDHVSKHNNASITLKSLIILTHKADPNYEEIDGGYVAFGGNPKGGKITEKCTIKTARIKSFDNEESLGEDASKQGRIDAIDADEEITMVSVQNVDEEMFDVNVLDGEEVFVAEQEVAANKENDEVNVVEEVVQVSAAANVVSTAGAATTVSATTTTTDDDGDITLAQALTEMKSTKPKNKGVVIQELGESTTTTITTISSQQSQDKGKGIMIEEPVKPMKKKDQISFDEEVALKLQAEFDEEERLAREKAEKEKEANIALIEEWDDIQAKIDVDYQLAERLQAQEQEELSIAEKATLFQQLLEKRRKHFAAKRAEEKRNKPPTKAQQKKIMCTYLKNMEGYKLNDLKLKDFDSIQEMFDRAFKRVNTFEDFRTELVEGKEKRAGTELIQENTKKQKVEDDKETTELKQLMKIIPDEEEVAIDAIPLAVKSPSIVGWKIYKEGRKSYYQIMRADGKSQMYMFFSQMLKNFDREDLEDLYKLVKAKFESTKPVEDLDLLLWGDLKTMFEPHVEDAVWRNQQAYKVLDWKLYDSCRVHSLRMQHMQIYMLVEKKYPLAPLTLSMKLKKKLNIVHYSLPSLLFFSMERLKEELYVCQPPGFEDPDFPDRVYKVEKALFTEVKTASTPIETQKPLLKDEDREEVDVHMYRSMIDSLMYLTSLRPDIMFVVCACARYQVNPKVSHLHTVKRIFRYLKGQPKLGLWYPKDSPFDLVAYTDSDYARASLDRKSTTGGCQFLGCRLISW
ncbi:hypothetical protein Tco_0807162 [Tanacetum coccineum]